MFTKLEQQDQTVYLALAVGNANPDVPVVEMKKLETDKVAVNLAALTEDLDRQGNLAHNLKLSEGRAKAVVAELVEQYGIEAGWLESHGAGPLAPVASNQTYGGRAKNRRVVLVQR